MQGKIKMCQEVQPHDCTAGRAPKPRTPRAMELPYTIFALGDATLHQLHTDAGKARSPLPLRPFILARAATIHPDWISPFGLNPWCRFC
jgi:hypothetical protein